MVIITEKILIKADYQIVWAFMVDLSKSLSFNRFHVEIIIPNRFSVNNESEFFIVHNFGFGNIKMKAEVVECIVTKRLSISEKSIGEKSKGFNHTINFNIIKRSDETYLEYTVDGTYGSRVQDLSFTPILKGVIKEEIIKIKNAIEGCEKLPENTSIGGISP